MSEPALTKGWYVLRAISGKEAKVKELLDGAIRNGGLGDHLFQVLIPTEKVVTIRGGKKVIKERNLFSGYVFIEAILTGELIHELTNTTNVIDFLRGRQKGSKPERLTEADVRRMMGTADEIAETSETEIQNYLVGETVKVTEGPFFGFPGVIEEILPDKNKLKVAVKIFGRKTLLELENWQVERE
ncbi:MAG: transcription termination/antitermination protein NusG [Muribaculaceae bacterium]|nr:transcription termination/antitermination protein NusG [Muribaculaceae bacterium]